MTRHRGHGLQNEAVLDYPDLEQRVAPRPFVGGLRQNPCAPPAAKCRRPEEPFGGGTAEGSLRASEVSYDCSPATHVALLRTGNGCPTRTIKATVQLKQIEITSKCPDDKPGHLSECIIEGRAGSDCVGQIDGDKNGSASRGPHNGNYRPSLHCRWFRSCPRCTNWAEIQRAVVSHRNFSWKKMTYITRSSRGGGCC